MSPGSTINMDYRDVTYTSVVVGTLKSRSGGPVTTTCEVTVPFLTNTVDIPSQAELLLEVEEKGVKPNGKQSNVENEPEQQVPKRPKQKAAPIRGGVQDIEI